MKGLTGAIRGWFTTSATSDEADAVLISVVLAMPLILTFLGWSVDFSKNIMIRGDIDSIAQESVTTAIKYQDGIGNVDCINTTWLTHNQAIAFVNRNADGSGAASAQAIATYMTKTGRSDSRSFNGNVSPKYIYDADSDYATVSAFRSYSQTSVTGPYVGDGGDSNDPSDPNYFAIRVTCSADDSSGGGNRGAAGRYNTKAVRLQVKDWTTNMYLAIPTSNNGTVDYDNATRMVQAQKFDVDRSAISSYSANSLSK